MAEVVTTAEVLEGIRSRCIGPPRGGRSVAIAGHPHLRSVFYFGAAAGGIWRTVDAGLTWENISDGQLQTSSVGALAVSPNHPEIIYAGMGEACIRNDVSPGDGVYRSENGGDTWIHTGLTDTRHIGEILVDPVDPERVYVAALGHAFGHNPERGIYRTFDGGETWQKVLHTSSKAGAIDITMDADSRDILYGAVWEAQRTFWSMSSGGPDSGIWKSVDGGDTWTEITHSEGFPPSAIFGRVGLTASGKRPGRVWALIESSEAPGLYRSDDFGESWRLMNANRELRNRPFYFTHVKADPLDEDRIYVCNSHMWGSSDGGATFRRIANQHDDNHDLWIDPQDNSRMIVANDGGASVSFDGGSSWSAVHNQLTAQIYRLATDDRQPFYYVYGTQQDNSTIAVPSGTIDGAITMVDCYETGTGESGSVAVDPDDHNTLVVGAIGSSPGRGAALQHYDHKSKQIRLINIWPEAHDGVSPAELKFRFHFTFPVLFSVHEPNLLYAAGNVVFRVTQPRSGMGSDQPRPDSGRSQKATALRRAHQKGDIGSRGLLHCHHAERMPDRVRSPLGWLGRWSRSRQPGPGRHLGQCHTGRSS